LLNEFVAEHYSEIVQKCRARSAARIAPRSPTQLDVADGVPEFLDYLVAILGSPLDTANFTRAATTHGNTLLRRGFSVGQVVHDYGDVCQTVTAMAIERAVAITTEEFRILNSCLDDAIADAVSAFGRQHTINAVAIEAELATADLGYLAHELRNLIATSTLAVEALRSGKVGVLGSTGAVLERSLQAMSTLVDRSLSAVRLDTGVITRQPIVVAHLIREVQVSASLEARERKLELAIELDDETVIVEGDHQILASIVSNLVHNAFKFTRPRSCVAVRTRTTATRVRIEVEDECGGLPAGASDHMFEPFKQEATDRLGLGLGLAICQRGIDAMGGTIHVEDLPAQGCIFSVELPRLVTN
jgi:signal transduction histidine kinase